MKRWVGTACLGLLGKGLVGQAGLEPACGGLEVRRVIPYATGPQKEGLVPPVGLEPTRALRPADFKSAAFASYATAALMESWWARWDLNPEPTDYEPAALPLSYRPPIFIL